nr:BREX-2 system adenine-specific DNA-methyltransferase PglX [Pseudomonadota bacterium]
GEPTLLPTSPVRETGYTRTKVGLFPVTSEKPLTLATVLDHLARERQAHLPAQLAAQFPLSRAELDAHRDAAQGLLERMIAWQEELDWRCYELYGITEPDAGLLAADPPPLALGQRAFEIVMARRMAAGELDTTWFARHRSTPVTDLPGHWPDDYKNLVQRRIALIESDRYLGLIERPEYKRRWNQEPWAEQEKRALRGWLLDRLETERYWPDLRLQSTAALADRAQLDPAFMAVAERYIGYPGFHVPALVAELVDSESVPLLPVLRYKPSGLRKREVWERTWELQRQEDAGQASDIPPPPKYRSADFLTPAGWRLRGALDVPRERFVSYPLCAGDADPSLPVGWAGWDALQQALALAGCYNEMMHQEGWTAQRLTPLLAGLLELLPWLLQWHDAIDPEHNERMGSYLAAFLDGELHRHGLTRQDLKAWEAPVIRRGGRKKTVSD